MTVWRYSQFHPTVETMIVSLPVCGGKARYAVGIPERWDDLFEAWTAN